MRLSDPISLTLPLAEPVSVGLDIDGHIVVDPVRPPPVVAIPSSSDAQIEAPVEAAASAPLEPTPEATPVPVEAAPAAAQAREPALWEWIAMALIVLASAGLLAWLAVRPRSGARASALDSTLARYRETLASASAKPAGAATT